jgi:tRNA(Ile)-lysidine synthase
MHPEPELVERFRDDLDKLIGPTRIGIAVSGGPDSLALLLLAAAAREGLFEAATVDHGLRPESAAEADMVAGLCERLGVPHTTLRIEWDIAPSSAIQEQARQLRYGALARWAYDRGLDGVATAHHLDDQAETFMMRLARGAGVRGLAGMRPLARVPASDLPLLRPLLGWRRSELLQICEEAGVTPAHDPSNEDHQFERVRVRRALADAKWLDPERLARSASNLAAADEALDWAADREWRDSVEENGNEVRYRPSHVPPELVRRIVTRAVNILAREGSAEPLRGRELDRLIEKLTAGRSTTLRGVRCSGGDIWRFVPAPNRTRRADNMR